MSRLLIRAAAVAALASAPLAALADGVGPVKAPHATEAPAPRALERGACVPSGPVGQLASVQGDVRAVAPDGSSRALGCDDPVNACEAIVTGPDSSAALLVDDVAVQIGPDSRVVLSAAGPAPELAIERGSARVVDARDEAAGRVQLYTEVLTVSTGRGDTEIVRSGGDVRVCAHDEAVVVMARDRAQTVPAGSCLGSSATSVLSGSPAGEPSVAIGDIGSCQFQVAAVPRLIPPGELVARRSRDRSIRRPRPRFVRPPGLRLHEQPVRGPRAGQRLRAPGLALP